MLLLDKRSFGARDHLFDLFTKQRSEVMKMLLGYLRFLFDIIKFVYQIRKKKNSNNRDANVVVIIIKFD